MNHSLRILIATSVLYMINTENCKSSSSMSCFVSYVQKLTVLQMSTSLSVKYHSRKNKEEAEPHYQNQAVPNGKGFVSAKGSFIPAEGVV